MFPCGNQQIMKKGKKIFMLSIVFFGKLLLPMNNNPYKSSKFVVIFLNI